MNVVILFAAAMPGLVPGQELALPMQLPDGIECRMSLPLSPLHDE